MGVLACGRRNCGSVMCDTYTSQGYICEYCKADFEDLVTTTGLTTSEDIKEEFIRYMSTKQIPKTNTNPLDWECM